MSVKIIYRPVTPTDKHGFLKVRITENRKTKISSLGIKIFGKNWLETKQRVSVKEDNHEKINEKIIEVLKDLSAHDNDVQVLATTNKTILEFYNDIISTTINEGTKLKYTNIRNKFKKYLESIGFSDLKFNQLTNQRVKEFHLFITQNGNAIDTANYNLKSFKSIINKAKRAKIVTYIIDPFENISYKFSQKKVKALSADEIKKILNTNFVDTRNFKYNKRESDITLNEIATIFLFQFFTQGLRCSDVQLLRWSSFSIINDVVQLDYTMFKTKKGMTLNLTPMALKMLNYPLFRLIPTLKEQIAIIELRKEDHIEEIKKYKALLIPNNKQDLSTVIQLAAIADSAFKPTAKKYANKQAIEISYKGIITMNEELLKKIEIEVYTVYADAIKSLILSGIKNDFIFFFLQKTDFSNFKTNNFDNLSPLQYKRLTGTRAYYNVLLKDVQKQCGIILSLTSHIARHSYTQLLLENNADITDISQSLGHSNLSTTQTYISRLPSNNITSINTMLSDQFS
ncbi:tyrosine-type recombinase/integrase [Flavobacterium sp. LB2P74]|uniref:tyrosine-type recombinase/integrase n=1 Tax=Flavobacterium sp. LB2P74 TaxID=3401717 RepID=UPI003AAB9799